MKILVINGVNMNFLGIRNKEVYGNKDYNYLLKMIEEKAKELKVEVECFQSNHEGAIVDKLQEAYFEDVAGISRFKMNKEDAIRRINKPCGIYPYKCGNKRRA